MGDAYTCLIPGDGDFTNKIEKAKAILDWLISEDIVKAIESDCVLGLENKGYAVSEGAKKIVGEAPFDLQTNGLEIITEDFDFDLCEMFPEPVESDLGFIFWNWMDFTEDFIEAFEEKLGCEVRVLVGEL